MAIYRYNHDMLVATSYAWEGHDLWVDDHDQ